MTSWMVAALAVALLGLRAWDRARRRRRRERARWAAWARRRAERTGWAAPGGEG